MKVIKNGISRKMNLKFQEGGGGGDDMGDIGVYVEGGWGGGGMGSDDRKFLKFFENFPENFPEISGKIPEFMGYGRELQYDIA